MLAIMVGAAFMIGFPNNAMAAKSGGRMGGSSFRAAPRSGPTSTTRLNATPPITTINRGPTVIYGAGFSPFGYYGYNPAASLGFTFAEVLIRE